MAYCNSLMLASFMLLLHWVGSLSTVPTFQITDKYIQTGTHTVNTVEYSGNISWSGVGQSSFNIPYVRNQSSPSVQISLQQLNFNITSSYLLNLTVNVCGNTSTYMVACLYSNDLDHLYTLRLRYIVLSPLFTKFTMYTINANPPSNTFINSTNPYLTSISLPTTNITGTVRNFLAFVGIDVTAYDSNLQFDLKASATYLSSVLLQLKVETTLVNSMALFGASFAYFGYSQQATSAWPFPAAELNFIIFSGGAHSNAVFFDFNNIVRDFNTFWGLNRMNINNQANAHFTSDISLIPMSSIQGKSNYPFNNLDFNLAIFKFKQCNSTTPYYMLSNDTCYDICPARYYEDNTLYLCQPCIYSDCYKCLSNASCTVCNATTEYRTLNTATLRCDLMSGYFLGGGGSASSCNSNCFTCSLAATNCTSCRSGTYLDALNQCSPCITNCQTCSTGTTCSVCSNYYAWDNSSSACVSTVNCSNISNCQSCSVPSGCTQCDLGYSSINIITCMSVCGNGVKLSPEGCDDYNNISGDGCSSNCTIEPGYYCNGSDGNLSICDRCSLHCSSCSVVDDCQACYSPYLLNSTTNCLPNCSLINLCITCHEPIGINSTICDTCSLGYHPFNNTCSPFCGDSITISPQQCDDGNLLDGDGCSSSCSFEINSLCVIVSNKSNCSLCPAKSYASNDHLVCLPCANYDCLTCNSTGVCLTCNATANRVLNLTINRCIPIDGFHDDGTNQLAIPCSLQCLTCSGGGSNSCLSCSGDKILINNNCVMCKMLAGTACNACILSNSLFVCISCNSTIVNGSCASQANLPIIDLPKDPLCDLLLTIVIPLLLALLCLCCFCVICLWRRRNNKDNKVDQQPKDLDLSNELNMNKKRVQVKVDDTEGNELSIDEFKDISGILKEHVDKQKSVLNKNYDARSEINRSEKQSNEEQSRGDAY